MIRTPRSRRGLSLVEIVVAVALLGVGISACVACVGSATRASQRAEEFTAVQLLARERLSQIELRGAELGEDQGDFGPERPGYGWQTATTESDVSGLLQVRLTILWGDPDHPRKAEFTTLVRHNTPQRRSSRGNCFIAETLRGDGETERMRDGERETGLSSQPASSLYLPRMFSVVEKPEGGRV